MRAAVRRSRRRQDRAWQPHSDRRSGWPAGPGKRASDLAHEGIDEARSHARAAVVVHRLVEPDAVVLDRQRHLTVPLAKPERDEPRSFWKGIFDGVGRKLIDQQSDRHGMIGTDLERLGIHLDAYG